LFLIPIYNAHNQFPKTFLEFCKSFSELSIFAKNPYLNTCKKNPEKKQKKNGVGGHPGVCLFMYFGYFFFQPRFVGWDRLATINSILTQDFTKRLPTIPPEGIRIG